MNWLKKLLNETAVKRAKAPIIREIKRAIEKLKSGQTTSEVIPFLRGALLSALRGSLPAGIGELLLDIVLAGMNWDALLEAPEDVAIKILEELLKRVEGARL